MMLSSLISLKSNSLLIIITSLLSLLCNFTIAKEDFYYSYYSERTALYSLKGVLNNPFLNKVWTGPHCHFNTSIWYGIKCSTDGHVEELVLENMGLRGSISEKAFINLSELSVLSFKNNSLSGTLMDFGLNPKLTRVDLSGNSFTGKIPESLLGLSGLESFLVQDNSLTGPVPWFNQSSLREFNVSNNNLAGFVPRTPALKRFGYNPYSGNPGIVYYSSVRTENDDVTPTGSPPNDITDKKSFWESLKEYSYVFVVILLVVVILLLFLYIKQSRKLKKVMKEKAQVKDQGTKTAGQRIRREENNHVHDNQIKTVELESSQGFSRTSNNNNNKNNSRGGQDRGKLMFLRGDDDDNNNSEGILEMGDLLKASAEGLGQGTLGSSYKAMMEGKPVVVVKRLRNLKPMTEDEFVKQLLLIGNHQKHPNLLPILAYYNSKNEKLLVYKYVEKGNLFDRLHGELLNLFL